MLADWEKIIPQFSRLQVAVVGDLLLDHYLWGTVSRTSPEAPVPIVNVENERFSPGGAANVALNCILAGARVSLFGVIGKDEEGKVLKELLGQQRIKTHGILTERQRPTTLKTRILAQGQQLVRIDQEDPSPLSAALAERMLTQLQRGPAPHGIILSDYNKGVLHPRLVKALISWARKKGIKVVGDPKGYDFSKYRGIDALCPNRREAEHGSGIEIRDEKSLFEAGRKLMGETRARALLLTRGAEGVTVFQPRRQPTTIPAPRREVFDITGAGDSFISYTGLAYFSGVEFPTAAQLGNFAGSLAVGKLGAQPVSASELLTSIRGETFSAKRKELAELVHIVQLLKSEGRKVVFTNGCFDLLHVGHLKFLEEARRLGDCLIVAINSDASVRKLKGAPRPLISEDERADLLASLHCVDYVVIFDELVPDELLRQLKPDVLVKGKNLRPEQVVGRDIVLGYGGQVKRLPLFHKIYTQRLIDSLFRETTQRKKHARRNKADA